MESSQTSEDQLENLSNLLINTNAAGGSSGGEVALIEQYEYEMDKALNEHLLNEKEQMNQRLFQSFQTSACTVAQMFKDKSTAGAQQQQQSQFSSWQSFQNSAGAITVLYKDSLESCKAHYDLGVAAGQHRKLKEVLNWVKKKKRRTIRKEELLNFLLGRQMEDSGTVGGGGVMMSAGMDQIGAGGGGAATAIMMAPSSNVFAQQSSMFAAKQPFLFRSAASQQQQQAVSQSPLFGFQQPQQPTANPNRPPSANSADTTSDLATFREALIMHNRSRDSHMPPPPTPAAYHHHHTQQQQQQQQQQHHHNHHHHHTTSQQPCDDLDCFFCEQIATHVEHKRSASSQNSNLNGGGGNFDMESPTRKRSRFY